MWIALEDISPDSGPFEFIRGSHRWPPLRRDKLFLMISADEAQSPDWPTTTERIIAPVCDAEITDRGANIEQFIAKKRRACFFGMAGSFIRVYPQDVGAAT